VSVSVCGRALRLTLLLAARWMLAGSQKKISQFDENLRGIATRSRSKGS
jgi:hypothetical protein